MTHSLNELESLLKKAAVGAGFPVGHAVAIAAAGVWLARRGIPVCEVVVRTIAGGMGDCQVVRDKGGATFQPARAGMAGPPAIDLLLADVGDETATLQDVDEPVLLLGLAGVAGKANQVGFAIASTEGDIVVDDVAAMPSPDWIVAAKRRMTLRLLTDRPPSRETDLASRYDPMACGDSGWEALEALAYKTYVPASDQSRISGAGAGLTDND